MEKSDGKLLMGGNMVGSVKVPNPNGVKKVRFEDDLADPQLVGSVFGSGQASSFSVYSRPAAFGVEFSSKLDPIVRLVIRDSSKKLEDLEHPGELCWICGLNFQSITTLYNHQLQCPPPEKVIIKEEVGSGTDQPEPEPEPDQPALDLIAALPGNWSVKAKRGTGEIFISVREQQEMEWAASVLLEMYNLELEKIEARKYQAKIMHLLPMGASWSYLGFKDFFGKWPKTGGLGAGVYNNGHEAQTFKIEKEEEEEEPTSYFLEEDMGPPKKKIKQQWNKYGSTPSPPEALLECPLCYKGFTGYQAKGGHRSTHNKPKYAYY